MSLKRLLSSTVFTATAVLFAASACQAMGAPQNQSAVAPVQPSDASSLIREIRDTARSSGLEAKDIKIGQSIASGQKDSGSTTLTGSCTVSAKVGIPRGTGVTISATAATCQEAEQMVLAGIKSLKSLS